jgi:hypothetical protein
MLLVNIGCILVCASCALAITLTDSADRTAMEMINLTPFNPGKVPEKLQNNQKLRAGEAYHQYWRFSMIQYVVQ